MLMMLQVLRYILYLAILVRLGHAEEHTGPVPVIGITAGIDQATGNPPLRMNINTLEQEGGPMW
jgi:hypothetical protein